MALCPGGEAAARKLARRAGRPDLVLVEASGSAVSGEQLCRFLKTNERFRSLEVVLLGDDPERLLARAEACGADDAISLRELLGDPKPGALQPGAGSSGPPG